MLAARNPTARTHSPAALLEALESRQLLAADLVAQAITAAPQTVNPDATILVNLDFRNDGDESATGFAISVHLSTNTIFGDADDIIADTLTILGPVGPGDEHVADHTIHVPSDTPGGNYYVGFKVDATNAIDENSESNNTAMSLDIPITVNGPVGANAADLDITGNGVPIVDGDTTPSADDFTDFGPANVDGGGPQRSFQLTNNGTATLSISLVQIVGANAGDFHLVSIFGSSLGPGESGFLVIRFDPSAGGARNGVVMITTNDHEDGDDNDGVFTFAVAGEGTETAGPAIVVEGNAHALTNGDHFPSAADFTAFGDIRLDGFNRVRTFLVRNTGNAALHISNVAISGPADFQIISMPGDILAPGGTGSLMIRFDPSTLGHQTALVMITSDDPSDHSFTFTIAGTGITGNSGAPEIVVRSNGHAILDGDTTPSFPDHTNFGQVDATGGERTRTFTIRNTGNASLHITGIDLSGADASSFQIIIAAGDDSLGTGESTTFQVRFNPLSAGLKNAVVTIHNNDADEGEFTFAVSGRGAGAVGNPEITVSGLLPLTDGDTSASFIEGTTFGVVNQGQSRSRTFTISNTGVGTLNLTGAMIHLGGRNPSQFVISDFPDDTSLSAGESTTFTITFAPSRNGDKRGVVQIFSNDSDESVFDFAIRGRGHPA